MKKKYYDYKYLRNEEEIIEGKIELLVKYLGLKFEIDEIGCLEIMDKSMSHKEIMKIIDSGG